MDWNELTVEQYQELYRLTQSGETDTIALSAQLCCICYRLTEDEVDKLPLYKFNLMCSEIDLMINSPIPGKAKNWIMANGHRYKPQYFINRLNFGQYAEAKAFAFEWVENIHKVMATICEHRPYFRKSKLLHEDRANDFLQAKFVDVYHIALFFYHVYKNSMVGIKDFMVQEMVETRKITEPEAIAAWEILIKNLDGFSMQK